MKRQSGASRFFSREQLLLLQTILLPAEKGLMAWEQWRQSVDIRDVDYGCQRLFPLLYRFLQRNGIEYPETNRLKGVYRKALIKNRILEHEAVDLIRRFNQAGIDVMLLKGAALVLDGYYPDAALRPMDDLDLLVPYDLRNEAESIAAKAGWSPPLQFASLRELSHALSMKKGSVGIDLHWYLHISSAHQSLDRPLWDRASAATFGGQKVWLLHPTHQLLHTCVHGVAWNPVPAIRWIVDACMILEKAGERVEWDVLITEAEKRRENASMAAALEVLRARFDAKIPTWVSADMTRHAGFKENTWFKLKTRKPIAFVGLPIMYYMKYQMYYRKKFSPWGFLEYLRILWGLRRIRQVPVAAVSRCIGRLKNGAH